MTRIIVEKKNNNCSSTASGRHNAREMATNSEKIIRQKTHGEGEKSVAGAWAARGLRTRDGLIAPIEGGRKRKNN